MINGPRFCKVLPLIYVVLATTFGGWGLSQRANILNQSWVGGTLWDTTARFHVWPWPYKFAAVMNTPALLAGLLLSRPLSAVAPTSPERLQFAPTLPFVFVLWFFVGAQLERRWGISDKIAWLLLLGHLLVSLAIALISPGYTDYLVYGLLFWLLIAIPIVLVSKRAGPEGV
jgi:hypothetical protein